MKNLLLTVSIMALSSGVLANCIDDIHKPNNSIQSCLNLSYIDLETTLKKGNLNLEYIDGYYNNWIVRNPIRKQNKDVFLETHLTNKHIISEYDIYLSTDNCYIFTVADSNKVVKTRCQQSKRIKYKYFIRKYESFLKTRLAYCKDGSVLDLVGLKIRGEK